MPIIAKRVDDLVSAPQESAKVLTFRPPGKDRGESSGPTTAGAEGREHPMQAYIDDSVAEGRALVFGGLIASAERWEAFMASWQRCLDDAPWDVFKMRDVTHRCRGEKLEHARRHYRAVREHAQGGLCFVVPIAPLKAAASRYGLAKTPVADPYFWAFKGIINGLAQRQRAWGLTGPVDFVFDERPEKEKETIRDVWEPYRGSVPEEVRAVTGRPPVFADDEDVLPLQAADMWVWSCRRTWLDNGGMIPPDSYPVPWGERGDIPQMILQWTAADIDKDLARVAKDLGL